MGSKNFHNNKYTNEAVHPFFNLMKKVMVSVADAKSGDFFIMIGKLNPFALPLLKFSILNQLPPCKLTNPLPKTFSLIPSTKNYPNPWTLVLGSYQTGTFSCFLETR